MCGGPAGAHTKELDVRAWPNLLLYNDRRIPDTAGQRPFLSINVQQAAWGADVASISSQAT
jgi:hypothetical protein